ncbi:uncharacterized protein LOC123562565 [Mercenaria mercenaria]|uniref:uncharacterized protein LOC123562565 n=1 Tax=Mercenaria mercenaria TaxID=6596 RepID=UPI00234F4DCC|nr:uncharacterized protein LOC123562565 [Mercenaria mercenaria]
MAPVGNFKMTMLIYLFVIIYAVNADVETDVKDIASSYSDGDILKAVLSKMEDMQAKIKKLEKSESSLKQSVSVLIGTTAQFRLQIADLEHSNKEKEERISFLENKLARSSELKRDAETDGRKSENVVEERNQAGREDCGTKKRGIRQTPEQVSFSAYLDHVVRKLGHDQPIVYNKILLNEAGAYSNSSGIFHVPTSGVYLFSWSVGARTLTGEHTYDTLVKLAVNGVHKVGSVAESPVVHDDNQGSSTVILRLKQGDEVWTASQNSGGDIFGSDYERTTSFTGTLLYMS